MTNSIMSFPPELHLLIIDSLWDSASDLKNCTLVSRFWHQRAIVQLFSYVAVSELPLLTTRNFVAKDLITRQTRVNLENWEFLKDSKHLTDVIRSLSFVFEPTENPTDEFQLESIPHPLPRLSTLEIYNYNPKSTFQLGLFLRSLFPAHNPSQTCTLTLVGILLRDPDGLDSISDTDITFAQNNSRIRVCSLLYGVNLPEIDSALFMDETAVFDLDGLECLKVQTFSSDCTPILQRFGTTIRHLELLLFPYGTQVTPFIYPTQEDLSVVSLVPNLTSLTLDCQYNPESLRTLSHQIVQITTTKPCTKLEKVTVVLNPGDGGEIIGSSLDKDLAQLVHALPSIRSIDISLSTRKVGVVPQDHSLQLFQSLVAALPETDKTKVLHVGWLG